jgi:zinc protease
MRILALAFISSVLISCASEPAKKSAIFPMPASKSSNSNFTLRPFKEEKLANGLRILWIKDESLPRISLNMMVQVGSLDEEKGQEGLNSLTASLLDQGTAKHGALALADELDQIGAEFGHSASSDFTTLTSSGLSPFKSQILSLFAEIVLTPAFQEKEIERRRSVVLASIQKQQDQPSAYADELLDRELFGKHPYAVPVLGTKKSVSGFQRVDFLRFYHSFYRPNNSILSVVGQFDEAFQKEVRSTFEKWQTAEIQRPAHEASSLRPARITLVHKAGLQQTQIRMGHLGITRSNPDFLSFRLANVVLGGVFASRLNQRVRDDLGLTYSIHSSSDARLEPGSFEISTFTRHEKTSQTILETEKLVRDFVKDGVTDPELDAAKALLVGQFPAALETPDRLAYNLMVLRRYGISDDYLKNFEKNVGKISKTEVNQAIQRNVHPENLQTVIYSDERAISAELKKLGPVEKRKPVE